MNFDVDIGFASERGSRARNEDFAAVRHADPGDEARGLIAAIAHGVSAGG